MSEIIKSIDNIWVFPKENSYCVKIRGWVLEKGKGKERGKVAVKESPFFQNIRLFVEERMDVATEYQKYENSLDRGFVCELEYPVGTDKGEKLELMLTFENQEPVVFFSQTLRQLEKHQTKTEICYRIEDVEYLMGKMSVTGWAYVIPSFGISKRPQIQVTDQENHLVECKITEIERLDVNIITGQEEIHGELGFRLDFTALENHSYHVSFQEGSERKQVTVSENGVKKLSYYARKLMKRGKRFTKSVLKQGGGSYHVWEKQHRATQEELEKQRTTVFSQMPKISIVVPAYRTPEKFLREMIDSVCCQSYENWELCIADGSMDGSIRPILEEYHSKDQRVRFVELSENYGISGNTNQGLDLVTGDYIALLDHDDLLTPDALFHIVKTIHETGADVLYTDEDKVTMDLKTYFEPHFKPDYSLDLLRSCNYICHFFVASTEVVKKIGQFREECNGSQDYDFILRCTAKAKKVAHIPRILYHWRCHPNSTAGDPRSKMYCYEAGKRSLEFTLEEHQIQDATVSIEAHFGYYRVLYGADPKSKTSIVLLPKGNREYVETTVASIEKYTKKDRYEIIVAKENVTISATINEAVKESQGEYLLFLEAGMEVMQEDWLDILQGNCQRKEVGAIGAPLLFRKGYILHSGKILEESSITVDLFRNKMANDPGYVGRMLAQQNVSAVSWKGMMVSKSLFQELGGFSQEFQEDYADLDFCLRIQEMGKSIVYTPYTSYMVRLYLENQEQTGNKKDVSLIREKWGHKLQQQDPYHNCNFEKRGKAFSMPF